MKEVIEETLLLLDVTFNFFKDFRALVEVKSTLRNNGGLGSDRTDP